jgi:hypothetical protein
MEVGLDKAANDAARYVNEAKLSVTRQVERIASLKVMGLPTQEAEDTLDVLNGTVAAAEYFEGLVRRRVQDRRPHTELSESR